MPDFQPDPTIFRALTGPGVVAQTPDDWQQEAARTQAAQALAQERRAKAQEAAQEQADQALVRELAVKYDGDPDLIVADVMRVNPAYGAKLGKDVGDWRTSQATGMMKQNEAERAADARDVAEVEAAGADPAAYVAARTRVVQRDPDKAALLPEQYDPAKVGNFYKVALTVDQIRQQRHQSVQWAIEGKWSQSLSAALDDPEVDTPEEWNDVLTAQRKLGAPPAEIAKFGAFIPDTEKRLARVRQLGLTPDQRSDNARMAAAQQATEAHQAATLANTAAHQRVMEGQGAERVQIARGNAARLARQPAGGGGTAKGGGRGVTSGDANRIADLDTSIDDLGEVRTVLSAPGSTGAISALEAWTPSVVTDLTGYGTAAKQRQAVIDRVKQVIGKALEGGVLRKEDEYKYEKILPTIRDAAPIVQSKLDGLEAAITKRRGVLLDSLDDAGYNVSAYRARGSGPAPPPGGPKKKKFRFDPATGVLVEVP